MKKLQLLFMFLLFANFTLMAQQNENEATQVAKTSKFSTFLSNFSVTTTAATPSFNFKELSNPTLKKASDFSIGEFNVNYKINTRFSIGLGSIGALGLCNTGYYNTEGEFVAFQIRGRRR